MIYTNPDNQKPATRSLTRRSAVQAFAAGLALSGLGPSGYAAEPTSAKSESAKGENESEAASAQVTTLVGKVVWLAEAMERRYGAKVVPEAMERVLALETRDHQLIPLLEDTRGRAFRRDERLRNRNLELYVKRFSGAPAVQVVKIHALDEDGKFELDYWCEICSIAMYELKDCECCQGPIELRRRPAAENTR